MRTIANFALSLTLVVTLLWGGCLSCSQYFLFAASRSHCCDPVGHCGKTPTQAPGSKACNIQPIDVPPTPSAPPALAVVPDPIPTADLTAASQSPLESPVAHASPPDLSLLHSVFRI